MSFSKLDYCQFLLSSQVNYTLTNLADHLQRFSHDTINRYLSGEQLMPRLLWENVREVVKFDSNAYLLFDDSVLGKSFGPKIEMTRRQWSGNAHRVASGWFRVSMSILPRDTSGSLTTVSSTRTKTARPNWSMSRTCSRRRENGSYLLARFSWTLGMPLKT